MSKEVFDQSISGHDPSAQQSSNLRFYATQAGVRDVRPKSPIEDKTQQFQPSSREQWYRTHKYTHRFEKIIRMLANFLLKSSFKTIFEKKQLLITLRSIFYQAALTEFQSLWVATLIIKTCEERDQQRLLRHVGPQKLEQSIHERFNFSGRKDDCPSLSDFTALVQYMANQAKYFLLPESNIQDEHQIENRETKHLAMQYGPKQKIALRDLRKTYYMCQGSATQVEMGSLIGKWGDYNKVAEQLSARESRKESNTDQPIYSPPKIQESYNDSSHFNQPPVHVSYSSRPASYMIEQQNIAPPIPQNPQVITYFPGVATCCFTPLLVNGNGPISTLNGMPTQYSMSLTWQQQQYGQTQQSTQTNQPEGIQINQPTNQSFQSLPQQQFSGAFPQYSMGMQQFQNDVQQFSNGMPQQMLGVQQRTPYISTQSSQFPQNMQFPQIFIDQQTETASTPSQRPYFEKNKSHPQAILSNQGQITTNLPNKPIMPGVSDVIFGYHDSLSTQRTNSIETRSEIVHSSTPLDAPMILASGNNLSGNVRSWCDETPRLGSSDDLYLSANRSIGSYHNLPQTTQLTSHPNNKPMAESISDTQGPTVVGETPFRRRE